MAKCGRECEVYSRVVGYYRPVRLWNKGKQEEFRQRTPFKMPVIAPKHEPTSEESHAKTK